MALIDHPGEDYGQSAQPSVGKEGGSYSSAPHPITDSMPIFRDGLNVVQDRPQVSTRPAHKPQEMPVGEPNLDPNEPETEEELRQAEAWLRSVLGPDPLISF